MSWDKKEVDHSTIGDPFEILLLTQPLRSLERSDSEFTPSGTISWRPDDQFLVYGTVARGYKTGGYNVFSITPTDDAEYDPEFVTNYEIGVRSTLLDGRLLANLSAFKMDYTDLQVNQLTLVGGLPVFQTSNAAAADIYGVELDANWSVTDFFDLSAALAVQEATFDDFQNANTAGDDFSGNRLTQAPKFSATFTGSFRQPVTSAINFTSYAEVVHRSRVFFDPANLSAESEGPVTLLNARVGLESSDQRWSLTAWGRNLTDKDYATLVFAGAIIPGQVMQRLAAPRTYGVELTARF